MERSEEPTIEIKLFVDKEKRRVLFAEADKDFVDVLFSWLTLPLGTIARLLGKQSQMGCLDHVYRSVEDLGTDYFQTKACKGMLLSPLNSASSHCCQLRINIDDTKKGAVYICRDTSCSAPGGRAFSSVPDAACRCGKDMQNAGDGPENDASVAPGVGGTDSGVFVNGCFKFIITDDLIVSPASTSVMISLFERFGVNDPANLEKTTIQLNSQKITSLLGRSLTSKEPLTGLYFDVPIDDDGGDLFVFSNKLNPEQQNNADQKLNNVKIRVLQTKKNSLLYAEVSEDFADLIFGLLSVPLGSMFKTYGQCVSKGCVVNLYKSIDENAKGCVKPECQSLLIAPKVVPFSGCRTTKILEVQELDPNKLEINACFQCFKIGGFADLGRCLKKTPICSRRGGCIRSYENTYCNNSVKSTKLHELNPKSPNGGSGNGGAYVREGHLKFMVTDDLNIVPLSMSCTLQAVRVAKVRPGKLLEKEISLTNLQVMELLNAALVSRNALSSVLLPPKKRKLDHLASGH